MFSNQLENNWEGNVMQLKENSRNILGHIC